MPVTNRKLALSLLPQSFAICKLAVGAAIPTWATAADFVSITRTGDELSIVAEARWIPADLTSEIVWRSLKAHGPFDLSEVGVLAALVKPLAEAGISVFAISTFTTDYLFAKADQLQNALTALRQAGHTVHEPGCA
jgi:uncharacterized protein